MELILVIPFIALLLGLAFTYYHVWYRKSEREEAEAQQTNALIEKLRSERESLETSRSTNPTREEFADLKRELKGSIVNVQNESKVITELIISNFGSDEVIGKKAKGQDGRLDFETCISADSTLGSIQGAMSKLATQTNPAFASGYSGAIKRGRQIRTKKIESAKRTAKK